VAEFVYASCALTSLLCAILQWRLYRVRRTRMLGYACVAFLGLALNNILLFVDLVVIPTIDLSTYRSLAALASVGVFIYGFIEES